MHEALEPYIREYDVTVETGHPIAQPACLFTFHGLTVIVARDGLTPAELSEAVGVQLGYIALGFVNQRRVFNADLENLERSLAEAWAAHIMIPDAEVAKAITRRWSPRHLAHVTGTTERMAHLRLRDWLMVRPRRLKRQARPPAAP